MSGENVVERIFKDARGFRIYDGPNEVRRMSLARKILACETEELKR
ncbi:acyl-CoA dehydrogenase family protein [Marinobacter nauticus]